MGDPDVWVKSRFQSHSNQFGTTRAGRSARKHGFESSGSCETSIHTDVGDVLDRQGKVPDTNDDL